MDEGAKRMEEGNNLPLDDDDAKNEVLKKQETTNINGDSDIKQQIAEQDDQQPVLVKQKTKRVATLDAFRGLTIVVSFCIYYIICYIIQYSIHHLHTIFFIVYNLLLMY